MYAIVGITGKVGGAVASTLLERGEKVRGIVRDASKAQFWKERGVEIVTADYDAKLVDAFTSAEGVFVMVPPNMLPEPGYPDSVARVDAVTAALNASRPARVVVLSSWGSEKSSGLGLITPNRLLEQGVAATGLPAVFLRAAWFMENIGYSLDAARATGHYYSFYQPLERAYSMVATQDVGRIAAEHLLQQWQGNRVVEVAGPKEYSSLDVAAALEKSLGQPVSAVAVPRDSWVATLADNGMPANGSGAYIEMVDGLNSGWIDFGAPGAEHVKGTTELGSVVKAIAGKV